MHNRNEPPFALNLEEKIDEAIAMGIRRGQEAAWRRRIRSRRRKGAVAALFAALVICLFSIRVSPVFAAIVREIPGMEKFVDLIRRSHDKGVQLAVDHDLLQPIGASDARDGMRFTVQGIIADHSRMVLYYDIEFSSPDEYADLAPSLTDVNGQSLPATISYHGQEEPKEGEDRKYGIQSGTMDIQLRDGSGFPDEVVLKVRLKRKPLPDPSQLPGMMFMEDENAGGRISGTEGTELQIPFRIDRARFADLTQELLIHQTVDIWGQKVIFEKAVISPLRVAVHMTYPASNTKQIFSPGDIRLVDDKGIEWHQTMAQMTKDQPVLYFESPYFKMPEALFIEGSWFRALDKDKLDVFMDLDKQEIIQAPDDKLSLEAVIRTHDYIRLDFELSGMDAEDLMMYSLFEHTVTDAAGTQYDEVRETGVSYSAGSGKQQIQFYLMNKPYIQPVKLTIYHYPQYIRKPYKIQIH